MTPIIFNQMPQQVGQYALFDVHNYGPVESINKPASCMWHFRNKHHTLLPLYFVIRIRKLLHRLSHCQLTGQWGD